MASYKAKQIARITDAVAAARLELRRQRRFEPLLFAQVFIEHGGVQMPGQVEAEGACRRLAALLLEALAAGRQDSDDADLAREIRRAHQEAEWARALELDGDRLIGFRLKAGPDVAGHEEAWEQALKENHGLGSGVFRKYEIAVLSPECVGGEFRPVYGDELEC